VIVNNGVSELGSGLRIVFLKASWISVGVGFYTLYFSHLTNIW